MANKEIGKDTPTSTEINDNGKSNTLIPEVVEKPLNASPDESRNIMYPGIASDSTAVVEISTMQTVQYSANIIEGVKSVYDLNKLSDLKGDPDKYFEEGKFQINEIWNGIHALNIHTEMFTVLFLIAIGSILNEVAGQFDKPHKFARWRDGSFGVRHRRLFQQAQQLADMGDFAKKFSPMGKIRLLQLEAIRKAENMESCEDILRGCPVYEEIQEDILPDEVVRSMNVEPFPDISYDLDNERIKHYLDSVITFHRLQINGINYADFDQAKLISAYQNQAIPVKDAEALKKWLEQHDEGERPELLDNFVMDRMKKPSGDPVRGKMSVSINKLVVDLVNYCDTNDIGSDEWWEKQKKTISSNFIKKAQDYLTLILSRFDQDHAMEAESQNSDRGGIS